MEGAGDIVASEWQRLRAEFLASCSVASTYSNKWSTVVLRADAGVVEALPGIEYTCTHAVTGKQVALPDIVQTARDGVTKFSVDVSACAGPLRMLLSQAGRVLVEWTLQPCLVLPPAGMTITMALDDVISWDDTTGFAVGVDAEWFAFSTMNGVAIMNCSEAGVFTPERVIAQKRFWTPEAVLRTPADTLLVSYCNKPTLHEFSCKGTLLRTLPVERNITCMALRGDVVVCIDYNDETYAAVATVLTLDGGDYVRLASFPVPTRAVNVDDLLLDLGVIVDLRSVCVLVDGKHFAFAELITLDYEHFFDVAVTIMDFTGAVVRAFRLRDPALPEWAAQEQPWHYVSSIVCTDNNEIVILANSLEADVDGTLAHVYSVYGEHLTSWTFSNVAYNFGFPLVFQSNYLYAVVPYEDKLGVAVSAARV